jgi:Ca2+/Na+ antiporter
MILDTLLRALQETSAATALREDANLFPWVEAVHVLALSVVVGSVAIIELRLIGLAGLARPVSRVLGDLLPCAWYAFGVAVLSGFALFASNAITYAHNAYFLSKLVLLTGVGLNALFFHVAVERSIQRWDTAARTPLPARLSGLISLAGWLGVVACGRWIGFTLVPVP